jgi:hypothetical protein
VTERNSRVRSWGRWVLIGAVAVLTAVTTLAVWAGRTVLDSDRFSSVVQGSLEDERVTEALSTYLTTQITTVIDLDQLARDVIPGERDLLAGPLAQAAYEFIETRVNTLIGSEQFIDWFTRAVETAHRAAINVIEGNTSDAVSTDDGGVVINLAPVIAAVLDRLGADGLVDRLADMPTLDENPQLAELTSRLSTALGVQLPDDFGQVTVVETGTLDQVEAIVQFARRFVWLLVAISAVGIAALIAFARERRKTIFQLGLAIIVADILVYAVFARLSRRATTDRPAGAALTDVLRDSLLHVTIISVLILTAVVLAARFTSPRNLPPSTDPPVSPVTG